MNGSYRFIVIRADGIVRTYCWWGSGDANGLHELLIISANGIIRLTFNGTLDTQMARSGSLLKAWPDVHIIYHMGSFDSGGTTADGIVRTDFWWDNNGNVNGPFFFELIFVHLTVQNPM